MTIVSVIVEVRAATEVEVVVVVCVTDGAEAALMPAPPVA